MDELTLLVGTQLLADGSYQAVVATPDVVIWQSAATYDTHGKARTAVYDTMHRALKALLSEHEQAE